jgi:hypothetical protein
MRSKWMWFTFLGVSVIATALYTGRASATPATGFASSTLATGRFGNIDTINEQLVDNPKRADDRFKKIWLSIQKTTGDSDVYVQTNVIQPGGDSGWHSHPGHSLVIVTAGTITNYESDDPDCKPSVYTQGMGFVDAGGDHSHLIRNEGSVPASTTAVQVIPAGFARRIDADPPASCHF